MQFPWQGIPKAERDLLAALRDAGFSHRQRTEHIYTDLTPHEYVRIAVVCIYSANAGSAIACRIDDRIFKINEKFPVNVIKSLRKMQKQVQEKSHG